MFLRRKTTTVSLLFGFLKNSRWNKTESFFREKSGSDIRDEPEAKHFSKLVWLKFRKMIWEQDEHQGTKYLYGKFLRNTQNRFADDDGDDTDKIRHASSF